MLCYVKEKIATEDHVLYDSIHVNVQNIEIHRDRQDSGYLEQGMGNVGKWGDSFLR